METPHQEGSSTPHDSSMSSLHRRFQANLSRLDEQDAEIQQLHQQTRDQQQRINELEEQVQHPLDESQVAQLRSELADRDRLLREQDVDMEQAAQTIEILMQQVQAFQKLEARVEQAQRDAEADEMLCHVLREGDDGGKDTDDEVVKQLRVELQSATEAQQQSSRLICDLEEERVWLKETAEMLSAELHELKEAKCDLVGKMQSEQEAVHQLEMVKGKADEELDRLKAMSSVREEMLTVLQTQVKVMHTDNQKLEHAITSCQRSADQRFQLLEKHRQSLEAENCHLRGELSSLKQDYTRLSSKLQDIGNGEFDMEKDLDGDGLQIAEYTAQLNSEAAPVMELEQVVTTTTASSTTTTDLDQENFRGQAVAASAGINQQQDQTKNVSAFLLVKRLELLLNTQLDDLVARRDNLSDSESGDACSDYDEESGTNDAGQA